jgi:hypothetical protein
MLTAQIGTEDPFGAAARDDPPHPRVIGAEIGALTFAPNAEILRHWKGPDHLQEAIYRITQFLVRYTLR